MLFQNKDGAVVVPQEGVTRKLMATGKDMMMTEVCVKAHVATPPHKHVHEQVSYIAKGSFDVRKHLWQTRAIVFGFRRMWSMALQRGMKIPLLLIFSIPFGKIFYKFTADSSILLPGAKAFFVPGFYFRGRKL